MQPFISWCYGLSFPFCFWEAWNAMDEAEDSQSPWASWELELSLGVRGRASYRIKTPFWPVCFHPFHHHCHSHQVYYGQQYLLNEASSSLEKLCGYSYYKYYTWCDSKTQYMLVTSGFRVVNRTDKVLKSSPFPTSNNRLHKLIFNLLFTTCFNHLSFSHY